MRTIVLPRRPRGATHEPGMGTFRRRRHMAPPVWTLGILLAALAIGAAIGAYRYATVWTPLQRLFLSSYLRSEIASEVRFKTGQYRLLHVVDRNGRRLPLDEEVQPVGSATDETFVLTELGRQAGDIRLEWPDGTYDHAALHAVLREWIYRDQTPTDLVRPALWWTLVVFGLGLVIAIP